MAGFFDIFKGSGNNFYFRDSKNASRFRPDANPVRQTFQGYVNFILNRDVYSALYQDDPTRTEFRTTISSLIRTADLPSVKFDTEVMNAYNRKRIVQTGVQYQPVSMTVYDTVGNDWLLMLMKYFAYHYMDPRNRGEEGDRDLEGGRRKNDFTELANSNFGISDVWDSNKSGFNPNLTKHFFERIDYVLYHGNRGVQYSIFNPVLTGFTPSNIDYSDNAGFRDFQLDFEYEAFTTYSNYNFKLSEEDLDRFEDLSDFSSIKTFQHTDDDRKAYTLREEEELVNGSTFSTGEKAQFLGAVGSSNERPRTPQPQFNPKTGEWAGLSPDVQRTRTYGDEAVISSDYNGIYTDNPFVNTLINVADAGLSAAINGGDVKDAALGAALGGIVPIVTDSINSAINNNSPNQSPETDDEGNAPLPGSGGE